MATIRLQLSLVLNIGNHFGLKVAWLIIVSLKELSDGTGLLIFSRACVIAHTTLDGVCFTFFSAVFSKLGLKAPTFNASA